MEKPRVLILDDDIEIHRAIIFSLRKMDVQIVSATSIEEAVALYSSSPKLFCSVIIDHELMQPDGSMDFGIDAVPRLRAVSPDLRPIMISGKERDEILRKWIELGLRYMIKPLRGTELKVNIDLDIEEWTQSNDGAVTFRLDKSSRDAMERIKLIGCSEAMAKAAKLAIKASKIDQTVLIVGESGTGKEIVAKGIHQNSTRSDLPFLPVNCSSLGSEGSMLESELFGHVKGAFTGATADKAGIFESARGGTVFLDEIQGMSPDAQTKLLRALQEKKIRRVGGNKEYSIDFRIIASAKPSIKEEIKCGKFKPDLYYRLNGFDIKLPNLELRPEDINILANHFLIRLIEENGEEKSLSRESRSLLNSFDWPGNVRQLEQELKRAFHVGDTNVIEREDFSDDLTMDEIENGTGVVPLEPMIAEFNKKKKISILRALDRAKGKLAGTSRLLKVDREFLRSQMRSLKLEDLTEVERNKLLDEIVN